MTKPMLPPEFADLELFAPTWCLATEPERWARRIATSMEELQVFYDAVFPRAEAAISYCDRFPPDDMPEDAVHLLELVHSLALVSFAVEVWRQPAVLHCGNGRIERTTAPVP